MQKLYGLVEAGGTKFNLGVARSKDEVMDVTRIPTTTPPETIAAMIDWFGMRSAEFGAFTAIGVASFGPLQLDRTASDWGYITNTPKPGWANTDLAGPLIRAFGCDVAVDTDVNGAALAEYHWGAGAGGRNVVYLTVGTGIGGGAIVNGEILHGRSHPEMGHMFVAPHPQDTDFSGICPAHGTCLEGLASGPAIIKRWGMSLSESPPDHGGRQIIAYYLAQAVCNLQSILEPDRIIMGGGVMESDGLIEILREQAVKMGGGYFVSDAAAIIQPPMLESKAGLLGALALAERLTRSAN